MPCSQASFAFCTDASATPTAASLLLLCCRLLERDPCSRLPAAVDCYERGVSLSGMSKAFGMPGIRIGWLALRGAPLMRALQRLHDYSTICSSAPSEVRPIWRPQRVLMQSQLAVLGGWLSSGNHLLRWCMAELLGGPCCQHPL